MINHLPLSLPSLSPPSSLTLPSLSPHSPSFARSLSSLPFSPLSISFSPFSLPFLFPLSLSPFLFPPLPPLSQDIPNNSLFWRWSCSPASCKYVLNDRLTYTNSMELKYKQQKSMRRNKLQQLAVHIKLFQWYSFQTLLYLFFLFPPSPQTRRANRPCFQICSSSHNFLAISTKGNDSILASHWNDFILTGTAWSTFDAHPQSTDFRGNHLFGLNRCASLGCSVDTFFEYVNFICPSFINCNILLKYHWFFITLF